MVNRLIPTPPHELNLQLHALTDNPMTLNVTGDITVSASLSEESVNPPFPTLTLGIGNIIYPMVDQVNALMAVDQINLNDYEVSFYENTMVYHLSGQYVLVISFQGDLTAPFSAEEVFRYAHYLFKVGTDGWELVKYYVFIDIGDTDGEQFMSLKIPCKPVVIGNSCYMIERNATHNATAKVYIYNLNTWSESIYEIPEISINDYRFLQGAEILQYTNGRTNYLICIFNKYYANGYAYESLTYDIKTLLINPVRPNLFSDGRIKQDNFGHIVSAKVYGDYLCMCNSGSDLYASSLLQQNSKLEVYSIANMPNFTFLFEIPPQVVAYVPNPIFRDIAFVNNYVYILLASPVVGGGVNTVSQKYVIYQLDRDTFLGGTGFETSLGYKFEEVRFNVNNLGTDQYNCNEFLMKLLSKDGNLFAIVPNKVLKINTSGAINQNGVITDFFTDFNNAMSASDIISI